MDKHTDLILRLQDEADLCRNDGASDIAALLDEAVEALRELLERRRIDLMPETQPGAPGFDGADAWNAYGA